MKMSGDPTAKVVVVGDGWPGSRSSPVAARLGVQGGKQGNRRSGRD